MLILTRRIGEAVRIGSNVRIQILSQHGNQVRIGIHAPKTSRYTGKKCLNGSNRNGPPKRLRPREPRNSE